MSIEIPEGEKPSNPETQTCPRIRVAYGDILSETGVEAIVSFLPEDLSWEGPVNRQILAAAGAALDEFILEHIVKPKAGDVFVTKGFALPFNYLIFIIIPPWDGGMDNEERVIRKGLKSAMELIEDKGILSVSIPSLGGGRGDIPLARAARVMMTSIEENMSSSVREIRIVCKTPEAERAYAGCARRSFGVWRGES
jgi:O-acetyl-ADP-ribose deacetylase (regulator of RNase III)